MMRIFGAQMPIEKMAMDNKNTASTRGFSLAEMIVVLVVFSMMIGIAAVTLTGKADKIKFQEEADKFMHVLKMAVNASVESSQSYAVVLDFFEGSYILVPYTHTDKDRTLAEEVLIEKGMFSENLWLDYILFDDGIDSRDLEGTDALWIRARRSGWDRAAKIGVLDKDGNEYSILTNRMNGEIKLVEGNAYLPEPREKKDVPF